MNRAELARVFAIAAGNAFMISHFFNIHLAGAEAGITVHTFCVVHLDGQQRDFIEQTVKRAQRTDKTAEGAEHYDCRYDHNNKNGKTVIKDHVRTDAAAGCQRHKEIGERHIGTHVLAKGHDALPAQIKSKGYGNDARRQENIFQITEPMGPFVFRNFRRRNFIQQILQQPKGTEPPADQAAKRQR